MKWDKNGAQIDGQCDYQRFNGLKSLIFGN